MCALRLARPSALNEVWNVDADAIAVIEWGVEETAEWLEDVNPVQLLPGQIIESSPRQRVAPRASAQRRRRHP